MATALRETTRGTPPARGGRRAPAARAARRGPRRRLHAPPVLDRREHVRARAARRRVPARRRRRRRGDHGGRPLRAAGGHARRGHEPGRPDDRPGDRARHVAPHERDPRPRPAGAARAGRAGRRAGGPQPRGAAARARLRAGHLDVQPGDDRRDDRQQLVGQPLDRLRHDARPRPRARGGPVRRLAGALRAGRRGRARTARAGRHAGGRDLPRAARDRARAPRGDRDRLSEALAPVGRLPARPAGGRRAVRPRALRRRLGGHAGRDHRGDGRARAAAEGQDVPRRPLRLAGGRDRRDGRRARARGRGDRADRPADPRPVAREARVPAAVADARGRTRGAAVRHVLRRHARGGERRSSTGSRTPGGSTATATTRCAPSRPPSRTRSPRCARPASAC